ncbi:Holo-[acyl-carrier-protein] synthase [Rothia kristinae]|nr:Holo-[acyl-carrier-protein] synthase [Rothia kristinae]
MIMGTGVDVVDIERFGRIIERTPRLLDRLFTPEDTSCPPTPWPGASRCARPSPRPCTPRPG